MSKKGKIWLGIGIGIGVIILAAIAALVIWIGYSFLHGETVTITDINQYETVLSDYSNEKTGVHSGYIVFPEKISKNAKSASMYFKMMETFDEPSCEFELECVYTDEEYEKEIERLKNISKTSDIGVRKLLFDKENYNYPAYVASDADAYTYEYALLSGKNKITYVLLATAGGKINLNSDYLPKDYYKKTNPPIFDDTDSVFGYSIYMTEEIKLDNGFIEARDYDYTR